MAGDALFGTGTRSSSDQAYDEQRLVSRLRNLFLIARDYKRMRYDSWIRNYRLVNNKHGAAAQTWMPAPRDSEIYPTLSALVGWMTDQNTKVEFIPAADPYGNFFSIQSQLANDLSAVFYSTWLVEDYDAQVKLALWDAFQYGLGVLKNVWDNKLADGYGNAFMRRVDPWAFYPDPHATSFADMDYCVEARRMSREEIERRWPHAAAWLDTGSSSSTDLDERPNLFTDVSRVPKANPGALPGGQARYGAPSSSHRLNDPLPGYVVYEYWLRENSHYYEDDDADGESSPRIDEVWRCVVICNGHVLMDERAHDLWSHGQHPYERYVFDDIGEFYGISLVDHLAYPQIYINRLLTAVQHHTELTGNPIFLEAMGSGTDRVGIINRPGQRLRLNGMGAMQNKPEWLVPPPMPEMVMKLVEFWISRIENVSGLSAIVKGATPTNRNAEGVMTTVQEAAFVRIRSALHNLEATLERCSIKCADLIVDNFTEPRIMAIIGEDGQRSALALHSRHFYGPTKTGAAPLKYAIQVKAGASAPTSRQARIAESDKLYAMGAIDDEAVLQAHQYPHIKEIIARLYDKRQKGLIGMGAGARQRAGRST